MSRSPTTKPPPCRYSSSGLAPGSAEEYSRAGRLLHPQVLDRADRHGARPAGEERLLAGQRPRALDADPLVPDRLAERLAQREHQLHVGFQPLAVDDDRRLPRQPALDARRQPPEALREDGLEPGAAHAVARHHPSRYPVSSRSFVRSWREAIRRTVPERERITSDSVVAPRAPS